MSKNEDKNVKAKPVKKNVLQGMNIAKLSNMRIIQKHLVYVIGLSSSLANKEVLGKFEYFGQYGAILKIVVNKTKAYNPNGPNGPSYSAYISYGTDAEASIAILAIDNIEVDDHILRASYGTTKYCTFFLKNQDCPNKDCLYLHHLADENDIINRDDMNSNTNIFYEQQLLAMKMADIFNADVKKKLKNINLKKKCIFPTTNTIYTKDIVLEQNNEYNDYKYYDNNSHFTKNKKKYNDEYYDSYYKGGQGYSDYNNEDDNEYFYDDEEDSPDNFLQREKSESLSTTKFNSSKKNGKFINIDSSENENSSTKFISKSKSPIMSKKKAMTMAPTDKDFKGINISLSPVMTKKIDIDNKILESSSNLKEKESSSSNSKNIYNINSPNPNTNSANQNTPIMNNLQSPPVKKLYRKRDESRFSFAKNATANCNENNINIIKEKKENSKNSSTPVKTNSSVNNNLFITNIIASPVNNSTTGTSIVKNSPFADEIVPDYVSDVICKKISRLTFFKKFEKYFEKENDYAFFEKQLKQNDSWSKFILSNMHNNGNMGTFEKIK